MTRVSLQMVGLCALLLLPARAAARTRDASRCISETELRKLGEKFQQKYNRWSNSPVTGTRTCDQLRQSKDTCIQVIEDMKRQNSSRETNHRSLSPWEFCIDRDVERFPPDVSVARCLCRGCVTDLRENLDYNSVPVAVRMRVMWRRKCPHDPNKYVVRKEFISIPVACTCVRPDYTNNHK